MKFLPVCLNISRKKILIVGGGKTALQKLESLLRYTRLIEIVAEDICDGIKQSGFSFKLKTYETEDLRGFAIVYACTGDKKLNSRIKRDAEKQGALVNVVDDPSKCGFISPAIYKSGNMSVAVSSDGSDVKKSVRWRNKIKSVLEND